MGNIEIGKNSKFFNKKDRLANQVGDFEMNVWRGFKTSISLSQGGSYLLVDFASRVLRKETALEMILSFRTD